MVRVLCGRVRPGYDEEALVLHRRHLAGRAGHGGHPGVLGPHGAHGTPRSTAAAAAAAVRRLAVAPLSRGARRVHVWRAGERGVAVPQTRTTVDLRLEDL